jgi:hypothetical protein
MWNSNNDDQEKTTAAFNTSHLIAASVLTATQLFIVAALFGMLNRYYASIMLFNAIVLPILMGLKNPRRIQNLIPMFRRMFMLGSGGFVLTGLLAVIIPKTLIDSHPIFLDAGSIVIAISATLPASMFPFSISLFLLVVLFNPQTTAGSR